MTAIRWRPFEVTTTSDGRRLLPSSGSIARNPQDAILREVYERTGDKPFERIEDVMTAVDFEAVLGRYRTVAGYSPEAMRAFR